MRFCAEMHAAHCDMCDVGICSSACVTDHVPLAGGCDYAGNVSGCKKALLCTSPGEARNRSIWLQAYYVLLARLPALA